MSEEAIAAFLREMRERHKDEIDAVDLPEGTLEYVRRRVADGDSETLLFMLKLGYLMGLQTGFAAGLSAEPPSSHPFHPGPLQA